MYVILKIIFQLKLNICLVRVFHVPTCSSPPHQKVKFPWQTATHNGIYEEFPNALCITHTITADKRTSSAVNSLENRL